MRQVFLRLAKVSRHRRPSSLRVPALMFRFLTMSRRSVSLRLLWIGKSGRSSTRNSSAWLRWRPCRTSLSGSQVVSVAHSASKSAVIRALAAGSGACR